MKGHKDFSNFSLLICYYKLSFAFCIVYGVLWFEGVLRGTITGDFLYSNRATIKKIYSILLFQILSKCIWKFFVYGKRCKTEKIVANGSPAYCRSMTKSLFFCKYGNHTVFLNKYHINTQVFTISTTSPINIFKTQEIPIFPYKYIYFFQILNYFLNI